jgi:hypothetical protein
MVNSVYQHDAEHCSLSKVYSMYMLFRECTLHSPSGDK